LFAADAVDPVTGMRRFFAGALAILLLGRTLFGMWLPGALSISAGLPLHTGITARPAGWPSREAATWLLSRTDSAEAVLITTFSYPDPLQIKVGAQRRLGVAWNHWEWLQDPAQRVKFVVFVGDVGERAPYFAHYAETHFERVATNFVGYTIYDCRSDGRYVAYPDAFNSADVYGRRGIALLEQKQCHEAIAAFKVALQVDPDATAARRGLMMACVQCGYREDAVQVGSEILQREPDDPLVNVDLAILHLELGRIDDGLAQCRKNIRLGFSPAISYGVLGQLLESKGDVQAAQDAYAKALSFDPTNEVTIRLLQNLQAKLAGTPAR
jgi:tetratricopeptide (TPR) repeat protein